MAVVVIIMTSIQREHRLPRKMAIASIHRIFQDEVAPLTSRLSAKEMGQPVAGQAHTVSGSWFICKRHLPRGIWTVWSLGVEALWLFKRQEPQVTTGL